LHCHSLLQTIHKPPALFFYFRIIIQYLFSVVVVGACEYVNKDLIPLNQTT